jgi:dTDP-4-dehydrorhamnose reductase
MRIAVIGSNGQLGTEIVKEAEAQGHKVLALTHGDICVQCEEDADLLVSRDVQVVINTAAVHNMVRCVSWPQEAYQVNVALPLVRAALDRDWYYLYVSTDYVFDGEEMSYWEEAACRSLSVYGMTKLAGELAVQTYLPRRGAVCRLSSLFGAAGCRGKGGGNLVDKIVKFAQENTEAYFDKDTWFSPTYAVDGARQIMRVLDELVQGESGVFHCANEGGCSHATFAYEVAWVLGSDWRPKVRVGEESPDRPKSSYLLNTRLADAPPWQDGLRRYIAEKYGKGE